ncbi:MAG: SAM-dependent methyltransferase, partial [Elusimicrobia bacterium]|nr:SAM-dependent methyltransferase [Elusimicrobiota bacterium]
RLLPLALTSDLNTGEVRWSGHFLVNPWNGKGLVDLQQYPKLESYFLRHKEALGGRNVAEKNPQTWYRTIDRINNALLTKSKLYIPDIKSVIHPVLDQGETYPHHNLYHITSTGWDLEVLGALLMSDVGNFFVECYGVKMRGGYLRMQAQYLRKIRVPNPKSITRSQEKRLISAFRNRDVTAANSIAFKIYGIDRIPE